MRFLYIRAEKASYPLTALGRALKVSRSGHHAFERRVPSKRDSTNRELTVQIREVYQKRRQTYGSPWVHRELCEGRRQRVTRITRPVGIIGRHRCKFCHTTDSSHGHPVAVKLLGH